MSGVRVWFDVQAQAKRTQKRIHVGSVFGICVEKNAELPDGHPNRKYKGRFVFQGNHGRDEENMMALFQDLGSAPASMAAAKIIDLIARTTDGSFGSHCPQGIDEGALCGPRRAAGFIESDLHDGTKGNEVGRRLRPQTPQAYVLH